MLADTVHYQLCEGVDCQALEEELVILVLLRNRYYKLNSSARFFFEALSAGQSPRELLELALERYPEIGRERLESDLQNLVQRALELGLLEKSV